MASFVARVLLLTFLSTFSLTSGSDADEILSQIRSLTEIISQQNTELISMFGEMKTGIKQEVSGMINETKNGLIFVNDDLAALQSLLDTDECLDYSHNCSSDAKCTDTRTSFRCECKPGFIGDGYTCEDIDECAGEHNCDENAVCVNLIGDYKCQCNEGFQKTANGTCEDIDECATSNYRCHKYAECRNTPGSFHCACAYFAEGDGINCESRDFSCIDPYTAVKGIGCIYYDKEEYREFQTSQTYCQSKGGDLFLPINAKHFLRLAQHFIDQGLIGSNLYFYAAVQDGVWLNGRKVDPIEQVPSASSEVKSCSYMDGDTGDDFLLRMSPCYYDWTPLCEYKGPE